MRNHFALTHKFLACVDLKIDTQIWDQCGDSLASGIDLIRCCPDRNLSPKFKTDIQEKIFCMVASGSVTAVTTMFGIFDNLENVSSKNNNYKDCDGKSAARTVGFCSNMLAVDINILCQLCERCPKEFAAFCTSDSTSANESFVVVLDMLSKCLSIDRFIDLLLSLNEKKNKHDDTASKAVLCVNKVVQNALVLVGRMLTKQACAAVEQFKSYFLDSLLDKIVCVLNHCHTFDIQSNASVVIGMAVDVYPNDLKPHRRVCQSCFFFFLSFLIFVVCFSSVTFLPYFC